MELVAFTQPRHVMFPDPQSGKIYVIPATKVVACDGSVWKLNPHDQKTWFHYEHGLKVPLFSRLVPHVFSWETCYCEVSSVNLSEGKLTVVGAPQENIEELNRFLGNE